MSDVDIRPTRYGAPAAQTLVAAAMADLVQRYGSSDQTPVEAVEFDPPEGCFLVAWRDGQPVACGGWRTLSHFIDAPFVGEVGVAAADDVSASPAVGAGPAVGASPAVADDVAEIKRMYVVPAARGSQVASVLLTAIEDSAREHGMRRVVLETGTAQPEAIRFYVKSGYEPIANYGYYRDEPQCRCFGRDL